MKKPGMWKILLITLCLLVFAGGSYFWPYRNALFVSPQSLADIAVELEPHYRMFMPQGKGPFPAVLVFHGCAGPEPRLSQQRAEWITRQGYVALLVDSFSGRGYKQDEVCSGKRFWGNQRVADVYASLEYMRNQPAVDVNRMALLGYAHGGWTILDALAYDGERPIGALAGKDDALNGVRGVVAYYPYCELPAHFTTGWKSSIPVQALLAGQDSIMDVQACVQLFDRLNSEGKALDYELYPQAEHGFDGKNGMNAYDPAVAGKALDTMAVFLDKQFK